jgi:hypothetical protein
MSGLHFRRESSVVREVASLGTVAIVVLLFLAFLTTLRPIAIAAVQGDKVIDARANEAATLAHSLADGCTAGEPSQFFPCGCGKPNCL